MAAKKRFSVYITESQPDLSGQVSSRWVCPAAIRAEQASCVPALPHRDPSCPVGKFTVSLQDQRTGQDGLCCESQELRREEGQRSSLHWSFFQTTVSVRAGPGQNQEPAVPLGSQGGGRAVSAWAICCCFSSHWQGSGLSRTSSAVPAPQVAA